MNCEKEIKELKIKVKSLEDAVNNLCSRVFDDDIIILTEEGEKAAKEMREQSKKD